MLLESPFHIHLHFPRCCLSEEVAAIPLSLPFLVESLGQQTSFTSHKEVESEAKSACIAGGS